MRSLFKHLKTHVFRGFLAVIPLGLSYLVIRFFYLTVDTRVTGIIEKFIGFRIPGLGILLVLIFLYLLGLATSHWLGRRAFSLPGKQAFKRAVMIEHFRAGLWSVGFVTGAVVDKEKPDERMVKVFIPTAPNPTTGFMVMVRESQLRDLAWTVSEAMNSIISGGIVGPEEV